ncbi:hypothetical protein TWF481_005552 [Arthrobotrys musiformis]|uniref:Uncharacterized protein n=1 Tax=Arthrobotrys musiformis TaxID=47236 RepID=A0AAV9WJU7_9PEZI
MDVIILDKAFETLKIAGHSFRDPLLSFHKQGTTKFLRFTLGERTIEVLLVGGVAIHQIDDSASFNVKGNVRGFDPPKHTSEIEIECCSKMRWVDVWTPIESKVSHSYLPKSVKLILTFEQLDGFTSLSLKPWKQASSPTLTALGTSALVASLTITDEAGVLPSYPDLSLTSPITLPETVPVLPFFDAMINGVGEIIGVNQDNEECFCEAEGSDGSDELSVSSDGFGDEFEFLRQRKADGTGWIFCMRRTKADSNAAPSPGSEHDTPAAAT